MKKFRLLITAMLAAVGVGAFAVYQAVPAFSEFAAALYASPEEEGEAPETPEETPAVGLAAGDYYIKNVGTGLYLNGANAWGTKASVVANGQLMTVSADAGTANIVDLMTVDVKGDNGLASTNWTCYKADEVFEATGADQRTFSFPEDGKYTRGFYLSPRDKDYASLTYGEREAYPFALPGGDVKITILASYWQDNAGDFLYELADAKGNVIASGEGVAKIKQGDANTVVGEVDEIAFEAKGCKAGNYVLKITTKGGGYGKAIIVWGLDVKAVETVNNATIDTHVGGGNHFLGSNGYVDSPAATFEIKSCGAYYTIACDGNYLAAAADGTANFDATEVTDAAKWAFETKADIIAAMAEATKENPVNVTSLIFDANFSRDNNNVSAWVPSEGSPAVGKGGPQTNMNAERWGGNSQTFEYTQTITGLPDGQYIVSLQGYYRYNNTTDNTNDVAAAAHADGTEVIYTKAFANDVEVPFVSIADEASVELYGKMPFSQDDAAEAFEKGAYTNTIKVKVTDGTLKIGVRKTEHIGCDWSVWDNFQLIYLGNPQIEELEVGLQYNEDNSACTLIVTPSQEGTMMYWTDEEDGEPMGVFGEEGGNVVAYTPGRGEEAGVQTWNIYVYEVEVDADYNMTVVGQGFEQVMLVEPYVPNTNPGCSDEKPLDLAETSFLPLEDDDENTGLGFDEENYTHFTFTAQYDGFFTFSVFPAVKVTFADENNYGFKEVEGVGVTYGKMVKKGEEVSFTALLGRVCEGVVFDPETGEPVKDPVTGEDMIDLLVPVTGYNLMAYVNNRTWGPGCDLDMSIQLKAGWQKKSYAVEEIGVDDEGYTWFEYTAEKDGVFTFVATPCDLTTDMLDPLTDMSEVETPDGIRGTAVGKDVKKGDHFYFRVQLPVSYLGFNPYYEVLDENGQPVKDTWYAVDSYLFYAEVIEPFVLGEPGELVLTTTYNEDNSYCSIAAVPTLTKPTTALFYSFDAFEEEMALVEGGKIELAFTPGRADENGVCKFEVTVREYVLDDEGNADFEQLVAEGFEEVSLVAPIEIVIVPGMSENKPLDLGEGWEIVARENIGMDDSNYTYFRLTAQRAGTFVFSCKPGDINPENITLPLLDAEDVTVPGVKAPFFGYEVEAGELITFKAILPAVYFGVDEEDDETYDVVDYNIYTAVIGEDGPTDPDTPVVTPPAVGEEEVCDLTADMFCRWDGFGADAAVVSENAGEYHIGEASGLPYGHGNVEGSAFADLSEYDALKLTVTEGAPRLLLNRQGMDNSGDFIEINDQKGQEYVTVEGDVWTIDIAKIVAEAGYAHLNCIKGANWADVTITEAKLVKYGEPVVGILANGNAEGAYGDVPCAYGKENQGDPHAADIETVDGSKVFVVHATAKVADPWDNQFWICAPIKFYAGDKVRISFRYKADKEATVATQQHCEPGNYNHWAGIGNVTFTTEWQEKTAEFEVTSEVDGNGKGFQSLAFNLNDFADANNYYFDNLVWEIVEGGTGISNVAAPVKAAGIYTLSGTQLNSLQNGINIVIDENGVAKKMILK